MELDIELPIRTYFEPDTELSIHGQIKDDMFNGVVRIIDLKKYGYIYEGQAIQYESKKPTPQLKFEGFGRMIHVSKVYYIGQFKLG